MITNSKIRLLAHVALLAATLLSCSDVEMQVELEPMKSAPGGSLSAMTEITVDDNEYLVASGERELFVRQKGADRWRERVAQWPPGISDAGLSPLEAVGRASAETNLTPNHYFAAVDGQIWVVAVPAAGRAPVLLRSGDLGRSWQRVELPQSREPGGSGDRMERSGLAPSLRLVTSERSLFLMDEQQIWRKVGSDAGEPIWQEVSTQGLPVGYSPDESTEIGEGVDTDRRGRGLPRMLRHYVPAATSDSSELVTVYGRQLEIYRRDSDEEAFRRISTLDVPDRDIARAPQAGVIYLLGAATVHRSEDGGETWDELDVTSHSLATEDYGNIELVERSDLEAGYDAWILGNAGGVWRSRDAGETWGELRERDADGRAVTGLWYDDSSDEVWVSTAGMGMLRTAGDEVAWREANSGMNAGEIYTATHPGREQVYVGTESGLYRRDEPSQTGRRLNRRATSALHYGPEDDRLVTGTVGGGIVVRQGGGRADVSEAVLVGGGDEVTFLPAYRRGMSASPSAILDLVFRPDSPEIVAWSHRRGPMISNDAGASWRRLQLGEAFLNAVRTAVVTRFVVTRDQTYFAVTRSSDSNRPGQLWRSSDGGATWQTTYAYREGDEQTPLQIARLPAGQGLALAHGSRVAVSVDDGETWTTISGPWQSGLVRGLTTTEEELVVLTEQAHGAELISVEDPVGSAEVSRRHRLQWPDERRRADYETMAVRLDEDQVLLQHRDRVFRGRLSRRATAGPDNVSLVIALGVVIALVTATFGMARVIERGG